jgi:hypothetical protein
MLLALLTAWLTWGCTAQQAYGTGQAWQRNQCSKLPDKVDYDRCMSQTQTTYESYKQQTEPREK